MDDLPTIEQIIQQADRIGDHPMSDEESRQWFEDTVEENSRKRRLTLPSGSRENGEGSKWKVRRKYASVSKR